MRQSPLALSLAVRHGSLDRRRFQRKTADMAAAGQTSDARDFALVSRSASSLPWQSHSRTSLYSSNRVGAERQHYGRGGGSLPPRSASAPPGHHDYTGTIPTYRPSVVRRPRARPPKANAKFYATGNTAQMQEPRVQLRPLGPLLETSIRHNPLVETGGWLGHDHHEDDDAQPAYADSGYQRNSSHGSRTSPAWDAEVDAQGLSRAAAAITVWELRQLKIAFESADADGSNDLSLEEFCRAFRDLHSSTQDSGVKSLFAKIDTDCSGKISWDEFLTFVMQHSSGASLLEAERAANTFARSAVASSLYSNESFVATGAIPIILPSKTNEDILTVTEDGIAHVWRAQSMQLQTTFACGPARVTAAVRFPGGLASTAGAVFRDTILHRVAVAGLDRTLSVLAVQGTYKTAVQGRTRAPNTLTALAPVTENLVAAGDDTGGVVLLSAENLCADELAFRYENTRPRYPSANSSPLFPHHLHKAQAEISWERVCVRKFSAHTSEVTGVLHVPDLRSLLTCGSDSVIRLYDIEQGREKLTLHTHCHGISDIAFYRSQQYIVTGGANRMVDLWHAQLPEPVASCAGHRAPIAKVDVSDTMNLLASLDTDHIAKVWDVRKSSIALQTIDMRVSSSKSPISAVAFDDMSHSLVLSGHTVERWGMGSDGGAGGQRTVPVCGCASNGAQGTLVMVDENSCVYVLDCESLRTGFRFDSGHGIGRMGPVTFNETGRKLLTAGDDGRVRIWNFSSGECLAEYNVPFLQDIHSLTYCMVGSMSFIIFGCRSPFVYVLRDGTMAGAASAPGKLGPHSSDITAVCSTEPHIVSAGTADGALVAWGVHTGYKLHSIFFSSVRDWMTAPESAQYEQQEGASNRVPGARSTNDADAEPNAVDVLSSLRFNRSWCAAGYSSGYVALWEPRRGKLMAVAHPSDVPIIRIDSFSTSPVIVTGDFAGIVRVWNMQSNALHERVCVRAHDAAVAALACIDGAGWVVSGGHDCKVRYWHVDEDEPDPKDLPVHK